MKPTHLQTLRILSPLALIATLWLGSNSAGMIGPDSFINVDKIAHVLVFGLLATVILRCNTPRKEGRYTLWQIGWAALLAWLVGLADETFQAFNPARTFEYYDLLADAIGASIAALLYALWARYRKFLEWSPWRACRSNPENPGSGIHSASSRP